MLLNILQIANVERAKRPVTAQLQLRLAKAVFPPGGSIQQEGRSTPFPANEFSPVDNGLDVGRSLTSRHQDKIGSANELFYSNWICLDAGRRIDAD